MDAWKFEIIFRVQQDISLVRFANSWDTVSWSILEINFIFPHIHVLFSLLFIIIHYYYLFIIIIINYYYYCQKVEHLTRSYILEM